MIQPDGKPVDLQAFLLSLNDGCTKKTVGFNFIDPRIIATGNGWIAWWRPAQRETVFFNQKDSPTSMDAWIPPMVFVAGRQRRAWLLPKNARPGPDTVLYLPGWTNTYSDGGICWGSGAMPDGLDPKKWESAFFASAFYAKNNFRARPYSVRSKHEPYMPLESALQTLAR